MEADLPLPLLVPTPVRRRVRLFGAGALFIAMSAYVIAASSGSTRLLGGVGVAFGIGGLIAAGVVTSRPVVELRTDGFVDRASLVGAGVVPWSATTRIEVESYAGHRFVAVDLDPTFSLPEARWRARCRRLSRHFARGDVWISESVLPVGADQFAELMCAARARAEDATP